MVSERNDRNFHVVHVGGPMNGLIEAGDGTMALLKGEDGKVIGQKIRRHLPWYFLDQNRPPGLGHQRARELAELAGIEPFGTPVYILEETADPDVYRYRFIGEYDPARDGAPSQEEPAPTS